MYLLSFQRQCEGCLASRPNEGNLQVGFGSIDPIGDWSPREKEYQRNRMSSVGPLTYFEHKTRGTALLLKGARLARPHIGATFEDGRPSQPARSERHVSSETNPLRRRRYQTKHLTISVFE